MRLTAPQTTMSSNTTRKHCAWRTETVLTGCCDQIVTNCDNGERVRESRASAEGRCVPAVLGAGGRKPDSPLNRVDFGATRHANESLAESLALEAADIALEHGLAMADAIIFATARKHDADIITADPHFDGLPGVTLIR